ncbi:hypothetical protein BJX66DRAFT_318033 [Aspergillus keveii]|uniref:Uncharacterized protein n=1 Tax=Aspergillus keveii TaxID=714993 RepID=A0ABR4FKD2_9EURO
MLAKGLEVSARRAATLATLLQEDLMQLKGEIPLDSKLKQALSALAETQPFMDILPVSARLARVNSAALDIYPRPVLKDVYADFTGSDDRFAIVKSGDQVFVYGEDGEEAIIFNERNRSVGRVPANILGKDSAETDQQFATFICREDYNGNPSTGYFLSWKVRTRILVCSWEDPKIYRGIGINLSTGKTGRFEILSRNCVLDP